ncbi:MAG: hypothetical protein ABI551_09705 [Polyangiaceae bacterium]
MSMDRATHQRFLEYRERHEYFGGSQPILSNTEFVAADAEHDELEAKGEARDDEEEVRFADLAALLFRD